MSGEIAGPTSLPASPPGSANSLKSVKKFPVLREFGFWPPAGRTAPPVGRFDTDRVPPRYEAPIPAKKQVEPGADQRMIVAGDNLS